MTPSRATSLHFSNGNPWGLCKTTHGHKIQLTTDLQRVTCKRCLFHLGLHKPVNHTMRSLFTIKKSALRTIVQQEMSLIFGGARQ